MKEIWVCLVHNTDGTTTVSSDGYSTYEKAFEALMHRTTHGGHWRDDFNYIDSHHRYELKCVSFIN